MQNCKFFTNFVVECNLRFSTVPSFLRSDVFFKMMYCYYELPYAAPKLFHLFRPYDEFFWMGLIMTLVGYSAVYKNPLMGLALFGFLLGQGVPNKFLRKLSVALLVLTVVTNAYLSVVTTDLVKPLRPELFLTYGEVYNNTNFR